MAKSQPVIMSRREAIRQKCAETGKEQPDPTPVHIPGKAEKPLSLREEMRRFVREELSKQVQKEDYGSFDEEDDFEEENPDLDMLSPYTVHELKPEGESLPDDLNGEPEVVPTDPSALDQGVDLGAEGAEAEGETPGDVARHVTPDAE